jgi:flagellar basal-body rod protein FlgC
MSGELSNAMGVSASGLKAQSMRLRVIAENIANAESIATTPNGDPYRRKLVQFDNYLNRNQDVDMVRIKRVAQDDGEFRMVYDPGHPAADNNGYVKMPNVNRFIETMDMKEAQRSYEANIEALNTARSMMRETVGLLGNN